VSSSVGSGKTGPVSAGSQTAHKRETES